jgi:lipoyl(octanoyl) transferase
VANQRQTPNFLLFCQHPHVYTLGKSGKPDHLLLDEEDLAAKQAKYYKINRGGDITYHGPGQIVGYPILDLDNFFTDIHVYMRTLEEAIILTLGVKASRWVTMHGFALNVNTDLSYFGNIVPCGIDDKAVTSLAAELGRQVDLEEVSIKLKTHLAQLFSMELK